MERVVEMDQGKRETQTEDIDQTFEKETHLNEDQDRN